MSQNGHFMALNGLEMAPKLVPKGPHEFCLYEDSTTTHDLGHY